jgi:phage baseplate assembly protein V
LGEIRVGIVSAIDPSTARVRVTFDDLDNDDNQGLLSGWLHVVQHGAMTDCGYWMPTIGSQVAVAMQSNAHEIGYVLGAIYSDVDTVPVDIAGAWYQRFADGSVIQYDPEAGVTITTALPVTVNGESVSITGTTTVQITAPSIELTGSATINGIGFG